MHIYFSICHFIFEKNVCAIFILSFSLWTISAIIYFHFLCFCIIYIELSAIQDTKVITPAEFCDSFVVLDWKWTETASVIYVLIKMPALEISYLQSSELKIWSNLSQPAITCSKLTIETLAQGVKYVQS